MPARAFSVVKFVANPTLTSVTPTGGSATTWTYKIVALDSSGQPTAASAAVSTAAGAATLDVTHFNTLAWTDPAGAAQIQIYRTVAGTSPSTLGLIGTVAAGVQTFVDNGIAGDGSTASASNLTGNGAPLGVDDLDDLNVQIDGTFTATIQIQGQVDGASGWLNVGSALTGVGSVNASTVFYSKLRAKMTAYTSGTVVVIAGGHKRPA